MNSNEKLLSIKANLVKKLTESKRNLTRKDLEDYFTYLTLTKKSNIQQNYK